MLEGVRAKEERVRRNDAEVEGDEGWKALLLFGEAQQDREHPSYYTEH